MDFRPIIGTVPAGICDPRHKRCRRVGFQIPISGSRLVYIRLEADMNDISEVLAKSFAILIVCLLLIFLLISMKMLAADARKRGKPAILVVLLAFASFPLGLLLWLVFRPDSLEVQRRQFQLQDHRMQ
jgi:hypothetical protein